MKFSRNRMDDYLRIHILIFMSGVFKGETEACQTYAESKLRCEELKPLENGKICYKLETEVTNNAQIKDNRTARFFCNSGYYLNGPKLIECRQLVVSHKEKGFTSSWNWSTSEPPACISGKSRPCPMTGYITITNRPKETTSIAAILSLSTPSAVRTESLHETSVFETRNHSVTKVHTINETEATTLFGTPSANEANHKTDTDLMLLATICGVTVVVVGISALAILIYSKIKLSQHTYNSSDKTYVRYDSGGQVALPLPLHATTNQTYTGHGEDVEVKPVTSRNHAYEHPRSSDTDFPETSRVDILDGDEVIPKLHGNADTCADQGLGSAELIVNMAECSRVLADPEQISRKDHGEYSHAHAVVDVRENFDLSISPEYSHVSANFERQTARKTFPQADWCDNQDITYHLTTFKNYDVANTQASEELYDHVRRT